ncbi:MAG: TRAP transporter substrate-binding protein DctP [Chromatiales bacterium]|jgi:TRAP-type C4-dicarboxylate transport system substrate-binding protein
MTITFRRLTLLFVFACLGLPLEAATLKIATIAPDGSSWMKAMRQGAEQVAEKTGGRVKLRFYPGGVMGNDNSILRKIRIGQLHGGAITGGGLTAIYPDAQIYSLPFRFRSLDEVDYVRQRMDPLLIEGIRREGFVSYGLSEGGFAYLMSKKPVTQLAELQQQKVWVPEGDSISLAAFRALDIAPIPLPLTDVLTGLQTELINTVTTPAIGAIALQWHTRLQHLIDVPITYLYGTLIIREKALNKLTAADRDVLSQVLTDTFVNINQQNRRDNEAALQALKNQGMQFIQPEEAQMQPWRQRVSQAVEAMVAEGRFSREIFDTLQQHLSDYRRAQQQP